jgi:hypothetical protein
MANLLRSSSEWLALRRKEWIADDIEYFRGASSVLGGLSAANGSTTFEEESSTVAGLILRVESRDWIVKAADLIIDAERTLPKEGDLVKRTEEGKLFTFKVLSFAGEPVFRFTDSYRTSLRIHTKLISTVDAP